MLQSTFCSKVDPFTVPFEMSRLARPLKRVPPPLEKRLEDPELLMRVVSFPLALAVTLWLWEEGVQLAIGEGHGEEKPP